MKLKLSILLTFFLYVNAYGQFGSQLIISQNVMGAFQVTGGDIDGDGDLDVVSAAVSGDKVVWHENTDGLGNFSIEHLVSGNVNGANDAIVVDIDGDGDLDIVSSSSIDNKVSWHENTNGQGTFTEHIITTSAAYAVSAFAGDMDGDGDVDIVCSSWNDDRITWFKNTDGQGTFGSRINILLDIDAAKIFCADFDGNGSLDLLYTSYYDDSINWMKNDGQGNFGSQMVISTVADGAQTVFAADIDGDGKMDALSASTLDNKIAWYKNTDGLGNFGSQQIITTNAMGALRVIAADLDGDGDVDVLSASQGDNKIAWYNNSNGLGVFVEGQVISTNAQGATSVFAGDLDGDGDLDVVSSSSGDNKVAWYKNSTITTRITENATLAVSVFPIPAMETLKIQTKTALKEIEIYNQIGQLILKTKVANGSNLQDINVSKLSKGFYFIKGIDHSGTFGITKMVKE